MQECTLIPQKRAVDVLWCDAYPRWGGEARGLYQEHGVVGCSGNWGQLKHGRDELGKEVVQSCPLQ